MNQSDPYQRNLADAPFRFIRVLLGPFRFPLGLAGSGALFLPIPPLVLSWKRTVFFLIHRKTIAAPLGFFATLSTGGSFSRALSIISSSIRLCPDRAMVINILELHSRQAKDLARPTREELISDLVIVLAITKCHVVLPTHHGHLGVPSLPSTVALAAGVGLALYRAWSLKSGRSTSTNGALSSMA